MLLDVLKAKKLAVLQELGRSDVNSLSVVLKFFELRIEELRNELEQAKDNDIKFIQGKIQILRELSKTMRQV